MYTCMHAPRDYLKRWFFVPPCVSSIFPEARARRVDGVIHMAQAAARGHLFFGACIEMKMGVTFKLGGFLICTAYSICPDKS
jgi:hypothetical protein